VSSHQGQKYCAAVPFAAMAEPAQRRLWHDSTAMEAGPLRSATAPCISGAALSQHIASAVVGADVSFDTPLGMRRRMVYCDYVASGRAVSFIEDYIRDEVLPLYGNTHTTTSASGLQTTCFRHEARDIVRQACNASEEDSLVFVGSGSTSAIVKLRDALHLQRYSSSSSAGGGVGQGRPVVFVGPYEHHSNLLPWREAEVEVVQIAESASGQVDQEDLTRQLELFRARPLKIGSFSAASNVTGVLEDQDAITACLHDHGAAAAAPPPSSHLLHALVVRCVTTACPFRTPHTQAP
jgi:selenocysteine lyase/cysteine desulfurase